jgi:hypothetical protein
MLQSFKDRNDAAPATRTAHWPWVELWMPEASLAAKEGSSIMNLVAVSRTLPPSVILQPMTFAFDPNTNLVGV